MTDLLNRSKAIRYADEARDETLRLQLPDNGHQPTIGYYPQRSFLICIHSLSISAYFLM